MASIAAGSLRSRICIQYRAAGQDDHGQPNGAWVNLTRGSIPANILFPSGAGYIRQETVSGGHELSQAAASIRIRWINRHTITAGMRIVHGSKIYEIKAVLPDEQTRKYIDLAVGYGANNG